jgi:hypothetical protein
MGDAMTLTFLFWFFMLLWVIFGCWETYGSAPEQRRWIGPRYGIVFILFLIVGWALFGFPIEGESRPRHADTSPSRY